MKYSNAKLKYLILSYYKNYFKSSKILLTPYIFLLERITIWDLFSVYLENIEDNNAGLQDIRYNLKVSQFLGVISHTTEYKIIIFV